MIFYLDDSSKKPILVEYNNCIYFLPNKFCTRNHPELSKVIIKKKAIFNKFSSNISRLRLSLRGRCVVGRKKVLLEDGLEMSFHRL